MRSSSLELLSLLASVALLPTPSHCRANVYDRAYAVRKKFFDALGANGDPPATKTGGPLQYLSNKTKPFAVDGKNLPDVKFDIGESYAGLLPISNKTDEDHKLFFWFFPSSKAAAKDEIVVWLNGGPGCSSLGGLFTENGPFLYQAGTFLPTPNPYGWNVESNIVWIEQPAGTGFSQGKPDIHNEDELAVQFKGFWKNFVDTFDLHKRKVYFTGESYAGYYVPYISNSFLEEKNTDYFNLKGIAINDPIIGNENLQELIPIAPFVNYWANVFNFDANYTSKLEYNDRNCSYAQYREKYFKFPPPSQPWDPVPLGDGEHCDTFSDTYGAALAINPCFNVYHILDTCPFPYDHLGIVNQGDYFPPGGTVYLNRTDVKKAIHAPVDANWRQCTAGGLFGNGVFVLGTDTSLAPALTGVLTNVIEKTNNTIIGSGALDFLIPTNGTLFAIQNLTWNKGQGLSTYPDKPFLIPQHANENRGAQTGQGQQGVWHSERGLTFYDVRLAGHELPGYTAGPGLRSLQLLLGRIKDLSDNTTPLVPIVL